jgi:nickel-dependent lactate racemase
LEEPSKKPLQNSSYDYGEDREYMIVTFKNHNIRRFSFIGIASDNTPPRIFEEIILGEPDAE